MFLEVIHNYKYLFSRFNLPLYKPATMSPTKADTLQLGSTTV